MWKSLKSIYFLVGLFSLFFSLIGYPELLDKWVKYLGIKTDMKAVIDQNIIRWIAFAVGMILIGIWSGAHKKAWQKLWRSKRNITLEKERIIKIKLPKLTLGKRAGPKGNVGFRERTQLLDPKLKINFKQGGHHYVKEQPGDVNGQDYFFSIELMNLGTGNINNPKARLFIKSSQDDNYNEQWNLHVNSKNIPKTDEEGEGEFVGVLKYFVHTENKIGDDCLWMIGREKDNNNQKAKITVQKYDIKIKVSSDNVEPVIKHFRFIPRPKNPKASMEMIEPIRGEKALELEKWINKYITIEPDSHNNPNAIVIYTFVSKLLGINNFCATYRLQNGKPYSVPLEKISLSWDDEHECLKLIIKP